MANHCSECTYLKVEGDTNYGKFWCKYCDWVYADQIECWNFCRAYSRPSEVSASAERYSKDHRYYILTVICKLLNIEHYNIHLDALLNLSDNYLSKCDLGKELLKKYDIIGPKVASCIENSPYKLSIAATLFQNFIVPTTNYVEHNDFKKATRLYIYMTERLMEYYKVNLINDECLQETKNIVEYADNKRKKLITA